MVKITKKTAILLVLAASLACHRPVMETVLNGYDQGKHTMKLEYRFFNAKLDDGDKGYRMETLFHFAIGNRATLKKERTAWLRKDFSLVKSEVSSQENTEMTQTQTWVEGNRIRIRTKGPDQKVEEKTVPHQGPVLLELHPFIFARDLKTPGSRKAYPVLYEEEARVVNLDVKYIGPETLYEENKAMPSQHYQIQVITNPEEFDDCFVDPETRNIQKIQFGLIKFLPAK